VKGPLFRQFDGTSYGNNGCTLEQFLGYRLVFLNNGTLPPSGCGFQQDFYMFEDWLNSTECGLTGFRRGFIFDGDQIGSRVVRDDLADFGNNTLGVTFEAETYRIYALDDAYCVELERSNLDEGFGITDPGVRLYGSGCPNHFYFNVLGVQDGVEGALGNLDFFSYEGTAQNPEGPYFQFAQVIRDNTAGPANWRTVVNGFSFHHLSEIVAGEECPNDSASIVQGAANMLGPAIEWIEGDSGQPFDLWRYPCSGGTDVDEEGDSHLTGPVNYLYQSRPNPFHKSAAIRFTLASKAHVEILVFDVNGRVVKTLIDGVAEAAENALTWDGTDKCGNPVGAGIFWVRMSTPGYESTKRMVSMR
jgi:hypothetical protein